MRRLFVMAAVGFAALAASPSCADDSSAALGAGGIVLTKGTPVRMKSEDLYVSPDLVRVRFEFANDTAKDISTLVAFPLPDINANDCVGLVGAMVHDPVNFVGFKASADGKPIAFKVEQRAFANGKDVTALVASTGTAVNPVPGDGCNKLNALPLGQRKRLIAMGMAVGKYNDLAPQWTVQTRFYWSQRFPAHTTVVIEHSYQPVTGGSFTSFGTEADCCGAQADIKEFCIDAASQQRLRTMSLAREKVYHNGLVYLSEYKTDYVLSTAKNWNGPIGRFHLTLDRLKPSNVLSLCLDGKITKRGPTTVEFVGENFTPRRDIHMVLYSSGKSGVWDAKPH